MGNAPDPGREHPQIAKGSSLRPHFSPSSRFLMGTACMPLAQDFPWSLPPAAARPSDDWSLVVCGLSHRAELVEGPGRQKYLQDGGFSEVVRGRDQGATRNDPCGYLPQGSLNRQVVAWPAGLASGAGALSMPSRRPVSRPYRSNLTRRSRSKDGSRRHRQDESRMRTPARLRS